MVGVRPDWCDLSRVEPAKNKSSGHNRSRSQSWRSQTQLAASCLAASSIPLLFRLHPSPRSRLTSQSTLVRPTANGPAQAHSFFSQFSPPIKGEIKINILFSSFSS